MDIEAVLAERDGEVVVGILLDRQVRDLEILCAVVGLLAHDDAPVLEPDGEVPAVVIAAAVLGKEGLLSPDMIGVEGERDGACRKRQRFRIARIQVVALLAGELRCARDGEDGGRDCGRSGRWHAWLP